MTAKHLHLAHVDEVPKDKVILELITYNKEKYNKVEKFSVEELSNNIQEDCINWINLDGLTDTKIIDKLQSHFKLHSLLVEDVLNNQRPKSEEYDDHLFVTMKMLYKINGPDVDYEQISFVLGKNYLLTFQEKEGDLFDTFRERIRLDQGRVRKKQADYLLYRLMEIIVESYYNVLDNIGEQIDDIEDDIQQEASQNTFTKVQLIKRELIYLHKALYPLREAISRIIKNESDFIRDENIRFFSDINDHVIHMIDLLDTYRDLAATLTDLHINMQNQKLNEVIRILTIISTIFIPLTFIVGVYGMNFEYFPELKWKYGYFAVWGVMAVIAASMVGYFKYKKWL
ncbi:magnesium/cobalt transporter CorA [Chryseosolibacter indicus]|uniref:Magnesium transport protein CorA n=1 Tax=Chryseosolibacter indicus TaxID=2782351 RepID=A0ABS5VR43_9BACT|nr:magnesium/cobalt transporter CorA [Chryseosolibacter indicus]MBT1702481.1 magnesium/cobalt transporter CorA [Chryseosolibacter indicus]